MNGTIRKALISVTDKRGLDAFAKGLAARGVEIVASGGTAKAIRAAGVAVTEISEVTGSPEIMDGRVKTLHPKVHGGILADRSKKAHLDEAAKHGIGLIDLVAVNLYRFREAASNPALGEDQVVEEIDIGGPTLIRAAAKNFHSVTVIVDPGDYDAVLKEMDAGGGSVSLEARRALAAKAYFHTGSYDAAVSRYFERITAVPGEMPKVWINAYRRTQNLRYGENPHMRAALYLSEESGGGFSDLEQLQGKELSYNNIQDLHAAFALAKDLGRSSCAIVKHMNPCGAARCGSADESFTRARRTDPASAFGGVVALNEVVDARTAEVCGEIFLEVIVARGFSSEARELLAKKKNLRLIGIPAREWERPEPGFASKELGGLLLLQERDEGFPELGSWKVVTERSPSATERAALEIAWKIAKHVRSNAIVICDGDGTVGVGAGQMSRVDSCRIAVEKARREGFDIAGTVAASDAFFPFPDGVETLAAAGVSAIIQPGGSIRDEDAIAAANKLDMAMVFTGIRHFRH